MRKFIFLCSCLLGSAFLHAQVKGVKHVILIGVDGMGANYLDSAEIPNMRQMMQEGAYTFHDRSVLPSSSADNWAAMTMGAGTELTGYTEWDSKVPELPSRTTDEYGLFPSIFSLLRAHDPKAEIGVVYSWGGIGYLFPKKAVNKDVHCDSDSATEATAIQYIKDSKPKLLFIHFSDVDGAGHSIGWGTHAYKDAIHRIDARIQAITEATRNAGILEETVIIVSADHGGLHTGHGGKTMQEMEIPLILFGHGVKRNTELKQSLMTYDTAATIAWIFGITPPQVWIGRPIKEAFGK